VFPISFLQLNQLYVYYQFFLRNVKIVAPYCAQCPRFKRIVAQDYKFPQRKERWEQRSCHSFWVEGGIILAQNILVFCDDTFYSAAILVGRQAGEGEHQNLFN